jgi:hypothetical protein
MNKKVSKKGLAIGKIGLLYPPVLEHVDDMQTVLEQAIIKAVKWCSATRRSASG